MKKYKLIITILYFLFFVFFAKCKKNDNIKLLKFSPLMSTKLDLKNIDSLILIKYYKNKINDSSRVLLTYKYEYDSTFPKSYADEKWEFRIQDSFEQKHDYKLIFEINKKKYSYFFKDIDYDTIRNGSNIFHTTKSYTLNNKKHNMHESCYYLDDK